MSYMKQQLNNIQNKIDTGQPLSIEENTLLSPMRTTCCDHSYIDTTEHQMEGVWWGRCARCKEMTDLYVEGAPYVGDY